MDIAREYLSKLGIEVLENNKKLKKLDDILRKGFQYPIVSLENLINPKYEKIKKNDYKGEYDIVEKISFGDGKIYLREVRETGMDLYKAKEGDLITSKINVHQGAVAISPKDLVCSTHYQVYEVNQEEIDPTYLLSVLRSNKFIENINLEKAGGIKNEAGAAFLSQFKIPLPSLDIQKEFVEEIGRQKRIIEGAERIEDSFTVDQFLESQYPEEFIEKLAEVDGSPVKDLSGLMDEIYVGGENIEGGTGRLLNLQTVRDAGIIGPSNVFKKNHVVYNKVRPNLQKCFYAEFNGVCSSDIYPLKVNSELILPKYLAMVLQSKLFAKKTESFQEGRSGMPKINRDQLAKIRISLPPIEIQGKIVEKYEQQLRALDSVQLLKHEAKKRIEDILTKLWGDH